MAVMFCVVASDPQARTAIIALAKQKASLDSFGRKVLVPGDVGFPSPEQISAATTGVPNPGAIVLNGNGTVFDVLSVADASNGAFIESRFINASL